ncbi:MAG: TIGR02221 family CRISPR-associated protein [Armatimonadetes bacterium]|nr:TIGR02221 family CRISPR-associated protein [Armatimonadota bacterium]MDW8121932.1 TIGR02221 family CRISPR-associated protein [Armatimonadota bacterium]
MKALTFLGTGSYQQVTYVWENSACQTNLFPVAVAQIFAADPIVVFVTPEVKGHKNFTDLVCALGNRVQAVDIPSGKSESELWEIFQKCVESVNEGEEILLDITHAFRSLPLIVFTVAAFLRQVKNVTIRHIVYGAFEAKDANNQAPIFDLTPLLDLLDWLSGAEFFIKRGDASLLGEKLTAVHGKAWRQRGSLDLPTKLSRLGTCLKELSLSLHLGRPIEVMERSHSLLHLVDQVAPEVERWARPFAIILNKIRTEAEELAYASPTTLSEDNLRKQLKIIEYLIGKGQIAPALLLEREWIVSWVVYHSQRDRWLDEKVRSEAEKAPNTARQRLEGAVTQVPSWFEQLPSRDLVTRVWSKIVELRNDLAHCGMRTPHVDSRALVRRAKDVLSEFRQLANSLSCQHTT